MDDTSRPRLAVRALWICALLALIASSVLGVALPADEAAAQALGGRQFTLTSRGAGVVDLTWATGSGQTGYRLNRITSAGTVVVAPSLAATATSFTDNLGTQVAVACYQLEILNGTNVVGRSDILCVIANVAGGTHPPRNVQIFTNETPGIGLRWDAPTNTSPAVIGYIVVPLGGSPLIDPTDGDTIFAPSNRVALDIPSTPFRCYIVLALIPDSALAPFRIGGFSDIVCAFVGTFSPQPATATATRTSTGTPVGGIPTNSPTRTNTVVGANTATPANTATATVTSTLTAPNIGVLLKTDDPDPAPPGGNILYTVTLQNTGQQNTGPIFVEDALPAGLTFLTASANQLFTCNEVQGTVACSSSSLAGGATATISILTRADNPCVVISPITNTVRARIGGPPNPNDPNTVTATQQTTLSGCVQATSTATRTATATTTRTITVTGLPATVTPTPGVDLTIAKIESADPIPNGQPLTYTIVVQNAGNISATNITVTDALDAGLVFQGAAGDSGFVCTNDFFFPSTVTCTGGNIGPNGGATITIVTRPFNNPCDGEVYTNTATVDPSNTIPESNETNNVAQISTICGIGQNTPLPVATVTRTITQTRTITPTVTAIPTTSFSFLKLDAPDPVVIGGSITYTLRLTNTGASDVSGIVLNDALPPQTTFISTGAVGGGFLCTHIGLPGTNDGTVTCANGTVAAGSTVDIEIVVSVTGCGPILNTATIVAPAVANNTASATTTVTGCQTVTPTITSTGTVTRTATVTVTSTPTIVPTLDIGPVTKTGPGLTTSTGATFNHVVTIPVTGTGAATWTASQVSLRDTWTAGLVRDVGAITFGGWATNPTTCNQTGPTIECFGGSITAGSVATVSIPMLVRGCGVLSNTAEADPNNNIGETNEANNIGLSTTTNVCDTQIDKFQSVDALDTSTAPAPETYFLVLQDVDPSQTNFAPSTVTDVLPANYVVQGTPTLIGATTGTCTVTGTPPAAQTVTCTNVSGPNGVIIQIDTLVQTSVARGNYDNTATVTTTGELGGVGNNTSTTTSTVFPFDVGVDVVSTVPFVIAGNQYGYQITVTNTSAGGFATGPFFVNGGLSIRATTNAAEPFATATGNAFLQSVTSASVGVTCTFPSASGGSADQRYSCLINNIPAGGNVVISALVFAAAAEADGLPDVSLDANATNASTFVSCVGGGLAGACSPEAIGFAPTNFPTAGSPNLLNNRDVAFTNID